MLSSKSVKNGLLRIQNVLDSAERGGGSNEKKIKKEKVPWEYSVDHLVSFFYPEKSRIINSIFWAILDIEGFPFFLGDVWESWAPSEAACGLGRNLYLE